MRLGAVSGLASELACLPKVMHAADGARRLDVRGLCLGMGPLAASDAARQLIAGGCTALLSFGVAGALDSRLRAGTVVIADAVVSTPPRLVSVDLEWAERLYQLLAATSLPVVRGRLFTSDRPLLDPADKRAAASHTSAVAVDMESAAVGEAARIASLPFLAVRAIADTAAETVPEWLANVVDLSGRPRLGAVATGCLKHPRDLRQLVRLALRQHTALAALRRVGPLLALD